MTIEPPSEDHQIQPLGLFHVVDKLGLVGYSVFGRVNLEAAQELSMTELPSDLAFRC
jgi:hypothetical protein